DDAAVLLRNAGKEAGHVFKGHDGNVEAVAEAHEPRALDRTVDIQHTSEISRVIRYDANRSSIQPRESNHDVRRVIAMNFEEVTVIDNQIDHFADVIRLIRRFGNDRIQLHVSSIG